ncbi:phage protein, partial [Vibrio parahaemolyticus]
MQSTKNHYKPDRHIGNAQNNKKNNFSQLFNMRALSCFVPINPMAEKRLLIKALGYLPNDLRWSGFRICEKRAVFITPSGREFSPKELESFVFWRDEHRQFVEMYGHFEYPKIYPAKENVLPF